MYSDSRLNVSRRSPALRIGVEDGCCHRSVFAKAIRSRFPCCSTARLTGPSAIPSPSLARTRTWDTREIVPALTGVKNATSFRFIDANVLRRREAVLARNTVPDLALSLTVIEEVHQWHAPSMDKAQ
jgi:hypothetical protein